MYGRAALAVSAAVLVQIATTCEPGMYRVDDSANCTACLSGFYCKAGSKIQCPPNRVSPPYSSTLGNCTCAQGHAPDIFSNCRPCRAGHYCNETGSYECPSLTFSKPASWSAENCSCVPGSFAQNGSCSVCATGTFCRGGDASPAACPEHAHSLPGSSVVEDCACLSPFVMLAGPVSSCVHVTQAEDTFLRWHGALPTVSTYDSKGTLALNVDTLSSVQKQAILDHGDTSCVGILGRVSHCDSEIQGMVMNSSHALVAMQNVLLNPRFVAVLFNVFRDAELDTATYIQRRELWTTALSPQASPNAQALTVFGYVVLQRQSQVDAHYKNVRVMLSSLRAAIYQHVLLSEGAPAVQVLVEPVMVRVSHEWYREDALECIAPAGQRNSVHNPVTSVLSDYNLYDVGQVPCPNAAQLQCLQQVLGASFDSNGTALRCDVGVRILYEGSDDAVLRSKITELVQGVFSVTGVDTSQSPAAVSQFWSLTHSYGAMEAEKTRIQNSVLAARKDSTDAFELVLFDSGLQSLGYWVVSLAGDALDFSQAEWSWLLMAANYSSTSVAWDVDVVGQQRAQFITALAILGHSAQLELMLESPDMHVSVPASDDTLLMTVSGYPTGMADMQNMSSRLCAYAECSTCTANESVSTLTVATEVSVEGLSHHNLTTFLESTGGGDGLACNATLRSSWNLPANASAPHCGKAEYFQTVQVFVPFPPEVVMNFVLDLVLSSLSPNMTSQDVTVQPKPGGSQVHAALPVTSYEMCHGPGVLDENAVRFLFATVWPYIDIDQNQALVQHTCSIRCTNESVNVDFAALDHLNEAVFNCVYSQASSDTLPGTQADTVQYLQQRRVPYSSWAHRILGQSISASVSISVGCPVQALVETFDYIYASEYTELPAAARQHGLVLYSNASGWNAHEKSSCLPSSDSFQKVYGCAHAVNMSLLTFPNHSCAHIESLNLRLSRFLVTSFVSSFSSVLLANGVDTLNYSASIKSGVIWASPMFMSEKGGVLQSLQDHGGVHIVERAAFQLRHTVEISWDPQLSSARERSELHRLTLQVPAELNAGAQIRSKGVFHMFSTSALRGSNSQSVGIDDELDVISAFVQGVDVGVFVVKTMFHEPLIGSDAWQAMSDSEKLLVDRVDEEQAIVIEYESVRTCAEVKESLNRMQFVPLPLIFKRVYAIQASLSCVSEVAMSYPALSCQHAINLSVSHGRIAHERCELAQNYSMLQVHATDDAMFLQALDVFEDVAPKNLMHFKHSAYVCEKNDHLQQMLVDAVHAFGKFCFIVLQGVPHKNNRSC